MSRGLGRAQRWVLAHLAAHPPHWFKQGGLRGGAAAYDEYHEGWASVRDLAGYWHHAQACGCDDVDDCRKLTFDVPRAEVESIRRAVKTLELAGQVETSYDQTWADAGTRRVLYARLPLSVEQAEQVRLAQRLRCERQRQAAAELAPLVAKLRGGT